MKAWYFSWGFNTKLTFVVHQTLQRTIEKRYKKAHSHLSKKWYLQTRSHPHHTLHLHLQLQLKEMRPNINKQLELIFRDLYNGIKESALLSGQYI